MRKKLNFFLARLYRKNILRLFEKREEAPLTPLFLSPLMFLSQARTISLLILFLMIQVHYKMLANLLLWRQATRVAQRKIDAVWSNVTERWHLYLHCQERSGQCHQSGCV